MNSLNIHLVTEVRIHRNEYLRDRSEDEFHTLTIEAYDRNHNTMEVMLFSKTPVKLEIEETMKRAIEFWEHFSTRNPGYQEDFESERMAMLALMKDSLLG